MASLSPPTTSSRPAMTSSNAKNSQRQQPTSMCCRLFTTPKPAANGRVCGGAGLREWQSANRHGRCRANPRGQCHPAKSSPAVTTSTNASNSPPLQSTSNRQSLAPCMLSLPDVNACVRAAQRAWRLANRNGRYQQPANHNGDSKMSANRRGQSREPI